VLPGGDAAVLVDRQNLVLLAARALAEAEESDRERIKTVA
jgi:hypothetical protein